MEKITIKDIAKICGVGVSTVSRAINNESGVSEEKKRLILEAIEKYHYVPNNNARNLKRQESYTIAVLIKGIDNTFFSPMISVFEREVKCSKYSFILQRVDEDQDEIDVAIEVEQEKKLKGIIFLGGNFTHSKEKLSKLTVPYVISTVGNCHFEELKYASVYVDDVKESYKIVDYLCKLGHNRIAILSATEDDESIGKLRLKGYKKALEDNHIQPDDNLIYYLPKGNVRYTMESGYHLAKKILEDGCDCTAIFAITDYLAIGACRAILESGRRIPEDIAVAGYDGIEITKYYTPTLTTIRQPVEEMAKETLHILFELIEKNDVPKSVEFPGVLIVGEST